MKKPSNIYLEYLDSDHWRLLRREAFDSANRRCEACRVTGALVGHHLRYRDPLEKCTKEDIMALCSTCHDSWHRWLDVNKLKVSDFDRASTYGAILVLRSISDVELRRIKPARQSVKIRSNPNQILRDSMMADPAFVAFLQYGRNGFKKSVKGLFRNHPNRVRMLANAHIIYKQRRQR